MRRDIFTEDHDLFRRQVRRFVEKEIAPKVPEWNTTGMSDRESWRRAGAEGLLGVCAPAEYGGAGADFLYAAIVNEEMARARAHGMMVSLHADICLPYLLEYGSDEQRRRWVPGAVSGDVLLGVAMTEPGAGSDLAGIATTARRDGDTYVLNGAKTFISNGQIGDLFIVVTKTDPNARPAHAGVSLVLVEGSSPGFVRGKKLHKLGLRGQDTSELFFEDCRVPASNLLGREGQGFKMRMQQLQQVRLVIAVTAVASLPARARRHDRVREGAPGVRQADRRVQTPVRWPSWRPRSRSGRLRRPAPRRPRSRRRHRHRGQHGEVVDHRPQEAADRRVRAAAWWLRLHARDADRRGLRRRGGAVDLCRDERDHEGDHRRRMGLGG